MAQCEFCKSLNDKEWREFDAWAHVLVSRDGQVDKEGIDYVLRGKTFHIACNFDGGYIGDNVELHFNFCPVCGRPL